MYFSGGTRKALIGIFCALIVGCLAFLWTPVRAFWFSEGISEETWGFNLAREHGCFQCHGAWGQGGLANPGAQKVPAFQNFTFLMSIRDEFELREWITHGAPERLRNKPDHEELKNQRALHMPAYGDHISEKALDHIVVFFNTVSGIVYPAEPLAEKGYKVAEKSGCFGCHGIAGRFDMPNPGSLTGRIPAWHGADFDDLARNEDEIREWILDGQPRRLADHRVASWFLQRQTLRMPAYRDLLSEEEVAAVLAYIRWLRNPDADGQQPTYGELEDDPFL